MGSIVWSVTGACNFLSQGHRWLCQCTRKTTASGPLSSHQTPRSPSHIQITLCYLCVFNPPCSFENWSATILRESKTLSTNPKPYLIKTPWCVDGMFSKKKILQLAFLDNIHGRWWRGRNLYLALSCPQGLHDPSWLSFWSALPESLSCLLSSLPPLPNAIKRYSDDTKIR